MTKEDKLAEFLAENLKTTEYHRGREIIITNSKMTKRYPMGEVPSNKELYQIFFGDYIDTDIMALYPKEMTKEKTKETKQKLNSIYGVKDND